MSFNRFLMMGLVFIIITTSLLALTNANPIGRVCQRPSLPEVTYDGPIQEAEPGEELKVSCNKQYVDAHPTITCKDGRWSAPEPPCQLVYCDLPAQTEMGKRIGTCRKVDCTLTYTCLEGYWYTGTKTRVCQRNKQWSGTPGRCEEIRCPRLSDPKHGTVDQQNRSYLSQVTIVCDQGFIYNKPVTRQCQSNATWSGEEGHCTAVKCPKLENPSAGRVLKQERSYLGKATIQCDEGYVYGKPEYIIRQCQGDNTWSGEEGICERIPCPTIGRVETGILSTSEGRFQDVIILQCNSGHILDGPSTITCQANGNWSSQLGHCSRPDDSKDHSLLPILIPCVIVPVLLFGCALLWRRYNKRNADARQLQGEARDLKEPFMRTGSPDFHCSFTIDNDFSEEYQEPEHPKPFFLELIAKQVKETIESKLGRDPEIQVTVDTLCKEDKKGFLNIHRRTSLSETDVTEAITETKIISGENSYQIREESIHYMDKPQYHLMVNICKERHKPDKEFDTSINIDTEYVQLKLLSQKALGLVQRNEQEQRLDLYQNDMEALERSANINDLKDEDMIKDGDYEKYILIRGRAGIGKSTLLQRLLWKWANGEWATKFRAFFMLNLRHLTTIKTPVDLPYLLGNLNRYSSRESDNKPGLDWLKRNKRRICFVLDGIDEIGDFENEWINRQESEQLDDTSTAIPIDWCFALMNRKFMKESTIIVSSRPFAGLRNIERLPGTHLSIVELVGLTRERVEDFVNKNVCEDRREFVQQTFKKNPILMSVSAITFYCAALCQVLQHMVDDEDHLLSKLTTYTQITAFIMQKHMARSMKKGDTKLRHFYDDVKDVLNLLSQLAYNGLQGTGLPRLLFDESDFEGLEPEVHPNQLEQMREIGLLMDTQVPGGDTEGGCRTLSQFVHLSIQEFLAMIELLKANRKTIKEEVSRFSKSQQFDMTMTFLYGIAFNNEDRNIKYISSYVGGIDKVRHTLLDDVCMVKNDLQSLQIAHESQSLDVIEAITKQKFKEAVVISGSKLTVIDVMAITFLLKKHPSTQELRLSHVELDEVSLEELGQFLSITNTIKTLELNDKGLRDKHIDPLMDGVGKSRSLSTLSLTSMTLTDEGATKVAEALRNNEAITTLQLTFQSVTDVGMSKITAEMKDARKLEDLTLTCDNIAKQTINSIAEGLESMVGLKKLSLMSNSIDNSSLKRLMGETKNSGALQELTILTDKITDKGLKTIAEGFACNDTLKEIWLLGFTIGDGGVKSVLKMLEENKNLRIRITEPARKSTLMEKFRSINESRRERKNTVTKVDSAME